jgi:hypothetical protein
MVFGIQKIFFVVETIVSETDTMVSKVEKIFIASDTIAFAAKSPPRR